MNEFEQLEKYKGLLDDGIITEEEFRKIKQKILGLKSDEEAEADFQQERAEALAEIEKMRAETQEKQQTEALQEPERWRAEAAGAESAVEAHANYQRIYGEEKAKERARLEALGEYQAKERQEQQERVAVAAKTAMNGITKAVLWIVTFFLAIMTLGCISLFPSLVYIVIGIISLLLTIMACPLITEKTRDLEKLQNYYAHKKIIVIILIIAFFAAAILLS